MTAAVPAKKVAGTKNHPVRRQRDSRREVKPTTRDNDYSDELRAKCRKGALIRKPGVPLTCPECGAMKKVVVKLGFKKSIAGKWYHRCTNVVTNHNGDRVSCNYFKVPPQAPVPAEQRQLIELQRTADESAKVARK